MIPLILAAALQAGAPSYEACTALVKQDAERALTYAGDWRIAGGGLEARQCLGLAYSELGRWEPAAKAFAEAALEAETRKDPARAEFWVSSGNAWLAAGNSAEARKALNAALASDLLPQELRGEAHLDRARAAVMASSLPAARRDIDRALELVPGDPFAWLLSSSLALRQDDLGRAQDHIAKAMALSPDDPNVLLQAGNVAGVSGELAAARTFFGRVIEASPDSDLGRAAQAALAANAAEQ